MRATITYASLLLIVGFAAGCGGDGHPDVFPVSGTVLYNGDPVEGAKVSFMTEDAPRAATAITHAERQFKLSTYSVHDGAFAGQHRISVSKTKKNESAESGVSDKEMSDDPTAMTKMFEKMAEAEEEPIEHLLPQHYSAHSTSPLVETVTAEGPNEFVLQLSD